MTEYFKPMRSDVLLERIPEPEILNTLIYVPDTDQTDVQQYRVVATGPEVKYLDVGDRVVASWSRMTPPITWDGRKVAVTDEVEILAVIDD